MSHTAMHVLALVAVGLFLTLLVRHSAWKRLARVYPLAEEWPDRSYPGTMVTADPIPYRVTVGANSRGITFHGFLQRLTGSAVFVPWTELTFTSRRSQYYGNAVRLTFRAEPTVQLVLPESVWANVVSRKPAHPRQAVVGV